MSHPDVDRIERLIAQEGDVVFFLGGGISQSVGYPSWGQLLLLLIDFGSSIGRLSDAQVQSARGLVLGGNFLPCGQLLRDCLGRRMDDRLEEIFAEDQRSSRGVFDQLVRIPARGFLTTNYDSTLEDSYSAIHGRSLRHIGRDGHELVSQGKVARPFLWKIHGDASSRTAVISSADYERIQANGPLKRNLYSLFAGTTVVFLGYGLTDHDLRTTLELLALDRMGHGPAHFAFMPDSLAEGDRLILEDRFGINVIPYQPSQNHQAVTDFVHSLVKRRRPLRELEASAIGAIYGQSPILVAPELREICEDDLRAAMGMTNRWGPSVGSRQQAAGIAEGLLALAATRGIIDSAYLPSWELEQLLSFQQHDGGFESSRRGVTNVQTQALAVMALNAWPGLVESQTIALRRAVEWLIFNFANRGWRRFSHDDHESPISTAVALNALVEAEALPSALYAQARLGVSEALNLATEADMGVTVPLASWTLRALSTIKARRDLDGDERRIADLCFLRMPSRSNLSNVFEMIPAHDSEGRFMRQYWVHPTASLVALGCLPWLPHTTRASVPFSLALHAVIRQESLSTVLSRSEPSSSEFIFPWLYRIWVLGEVLGTVDREASQ